MTIAMLALAGLPATAGFFGKIYLIDAAVDNGYAWLGVVIVIGSAISLAYYLRVIAAVWMRSPSEAPSGAAGPAGAAGDRRRVAGGRRRGRASAASRAPPSAIRRGPTFGLPPSPVRGRALRHPVVCFRPSPAR